MFLILCTVMNLFVLFSHVKYVLDETGSIIWPAVATGTSAIALFFKFCQPSPGIADAN